MNYKEIIKQKADEYAKKELGKDSDKYANFYSGDIEAAYKAGAEAMLEIANTWIPVEKELPEDALIPKDGLISGYDILVKFPNGSIRLADRRYSNDHNRYVWRDKNNEVLFNAAEWKPIAL